MQLNAINSVNFRCSNCDSSNKQTFVGIPTEAQSTIDVLDKLADKAKSDVHPSTIIATGVAVLATALSVRKAVPYIRKTAVKVGEVVVNCVTNTAIKVANKFKKEGNKIDAEKTLNNISQKAQDLINGKEGSKFAEKTSKFFADITGKESSEVQEFITGKLNIKNGIDAADTAVAIAAGAIALDPVSDKMEENADTKDIMRGIAEVAPELLGTI